MAMNPNPKIWCEARGRLVPLDKLSLGELGQALVSHKVETKEQLVTCIATSYEVVDGKLRAVVGWVD